MTFKKCSMTIEQEVEHLKFLKRRLQFLKMNGNNRQKYNEIRESVNEYLDELEVSLLEG
jgi:hypothetical protein